MTKTKVVLREPRKTLVALFVTLRLSWLLNFFVEVLRRDINWIGGISGVNGEL